MKEHLFTAELWLARPPTEIFPFFAEARNLGSITPPWLHFEILTPGRIEMDVGTLIDYRIKLHGLMVRFGLKLCRIPRFLAPSGLSMFCLASTGLNGTKMRWIWDVFLPRKPKGSKNLAQCFNP